MKKKKRDQPTRLNPSQCRKGVNFYFVFIFSIFLSKGFLSFVEEESFLHFFPMDILKKGLDIIGPFKTVIDHKGVFKDIHDENGHSS